MGIRMAMIAAALMVAPSVRAASPDGVRTLAGAGDQLYRCEHDASGFTWSFQHPDAELRDAAGTAVVQHGAGPHWTATDGSTVYGTVVTTIPSPSPTAVPWLVLRASRHDGASWLDGVTFILRTDTQGGVPPAAGCDQQSIGAQYRAHYTAKYTFIPGPPAAAPQ